MNHRKDETITLSITLGTKEKLEKIAYELGFRWGEKPNISVFLDAIARREVPVVKSLDPIQPEKLSPIQLSAMKEAIKYFVDVGDFEKVYTLASIVNIYG